MNATATLWASTGKPLTGFGAGKYRLTSDYLHFETGGFSTNAQQIPTAHITDVDLRQSMTQKARGVGTLVAHVVRPTGEHEAVEIVDVPDFRQGVELINNVAKHARAQFVREQRTQHLNYAGTATGPSAPIQTGDLISQLQQLVAMHERGTVTDQQFIQDVHRLIPRP